MSAPISRRQLLVGAGGAALGAALIGCGPDREVDRIAFLNWQDYVDRALLTDFERRTGVVVTYETYESNDELSRKLGLAGRVRRGGRGGTTFDLIVPSDNFVTRFLNADLLEELDAERLPHLDSLAAEFMALAVDTGNRHSVPWATGTTGIGYDTTVFTEPPGYDVFLDEAHAGEMTLLNETRDTMALALLSLGEDPNTTDQSAIDAAADRLIEMKAVVRGFDSGGYLDDLASGALVAAHGYSSDVLIARETNPNLAFVLPEPGALRWVDLMCIPDGARSPDTTHRLIDFFLEPKVAAANTVAIKAWTGNDESRQFLPAEVLDDPVIFPSTAQSEQLVFLKDLGATEDRYADAWNRVQDA